MSGLKVVIESEKRQGKEGEKRRSNSKKRQRAGSKSAAVMTISWKTVPWIHRDCTSRGSQRLRASSLPSNLGERTPSSAPCGVIELQLKVRESQSHCWGSRIRSHLHMRCTGHIECDTVTYGHFTSPDALLTPVSLAKHLSVLPFSSYMIFLYFLSIYSHLLAVLWLPLCNPTPHRSLLLYQVFTHWKPLERLFGGSCGGTSAPRPSLPQLPTHLNRIHSRDTP